MAEGYQNITYDSNCYNYEDATLGVYARQLINHRDKIGIIFVSTPTAFIANGSKLLSITNGTAKSESSTYFMGEDSTRSVQKCSFRLRPNGDLHLICHGYNASVRGSATIVYDLA